MGGTVRLRATRLIVHDHVHFEAGAELAVLPEHAAPLLACGAAVAVEAVKESPAPPGPTKSGPATAPEGGGGAEAGGADGMRASNPAAASQGAPAGTDAPPVETSQTGAGAAEGKAAPAKTTGKGKKPTKPKGG